MPDLDISALRALANKPLDERTDLGTVVQILRDGELQGRTLVLAESEHDIPAQPWYIPATETRSGDWTTADQVAEMVTEVVAVPVPPAALDALLDAADEHIAVRGILDKAVLGLAAPGPADMSTTMRALSAARQLDELRAAYAEALNERDVYADALDRIIRDDPATADEYESVSTSLQVVGSQAQVIAAATRRPRAANTGRADR